MDWTDQLHDLVEEIRDELAVFVVGSLTAAGYKIYQAPQPKAKQA